jgi:hypothetical protein
MQIETVKKGGVDEWGEPIPAMTGWSDPIDCNIETNADNRVGKYEDGEFRQASFIVLVESNFPIKTSRVKLSRYDDELGEYRVLSYTPLPSMGRTKIIV